MLLKNLISWVSLNPNLSVINFQLVDEDLLVNDFCKKNLTASVESALKEHGKEAIMNARESGEDEKLCIHAAAEKGHQALVSFLLKNGAPVDSKTTSESTPLHYAARNGHFATAELLVASGADFNAVNLAGFTPLQEAAEQGHVDIVKLLLDHGSKVDERVNGMDVNRKGISGSYRHLTPLHSAALRGHLAIVELLLDSGANVDSKDQEGATPLHFAALSNHPGMIRLLVSRGANVDEVNDVGEKPLELATNRNHGYGLNKEAIVELVSAGASIKGLSNYEQEIRIAIEEGKKQRAGEGVSEK